MELPMSHFVCIVLRALSKIGNWQAQISRDAMQFSTLLVPFLCGALHIKELYGRKSSFFICFFEKSRVGHDMIQKIGYHDIISLFRDRDMELFTFFYVIYDLDMIWRFSEKIISYHWISPKPGTEKYPFSIVVQDLQFSSNKSCVRKQLLFP